MNSFSSLKEKVIKTWEKNFWTRNNFIMYEISKGCKKVPYDRKYKRWVQFATRKSKLSNLYTKI